MTRHPHDRSDEDQSRLTGASIEELDSMLRGLPLTPPEKSLDRRMADLFAAAAQRQLATAAQRSSLRWIRPALLSAAAVILIGFGVGLLNPDQQPIRPGVHVAVRPPSSPIVPAMLQQNEPVELDLTTRLALAANQTAPARINLPAMSVPRSPIGLQQTFDRVDDDGVVLVKDGAAYRRMRRQAVRQIVVVDPRTGEQSVVSIPTRELYVRRVEPF
jgi:multidrug efflux pump subunit AcrA (membrane-fusion protein)